MALIPIARPWTEQPQVTADQDWSHPLSRGLLVRVLGADRVGGAFPSIGSVGGISGAITGGSPDVSARGRAWSMAGGTDRVNLGASLALKPPSTTVCGWFRPESLTNAYSGLVSSATSIYRGLLLKSSGKLAVYVNFGGSPLSYDGTGAYTLSTGVWYHVAFTYNAATGALTGYVNAQVDATVSTSPADLPTNTSDTHIGNDPFSLTTRQFVGAWQNVRIYNRALSQGELAALYENEYQDLEPRRTWVPVSAGGSGAYTLTAGQGGYTLTGQAAGLLATRFLAGGQGSYALTGQDAAFVRGVALTADQGSYTLTGQDAAFVRALTLAAAQGSYALTGQNAALLRGIVVTADQGAYALTGQGATLTYTPAGAYSLTADQGSYALTGQDAALRLAAVLAAAQGSYTLTGQDATFTRGQLLVAGQGSYALTGQAAGFARTYAMSAGYGVYTLTGQVVSITYSGAVFGEASWVFLVAPEDGTMYVAAEDGALIVPREDYPAATVQ